MKFADIRSALIQSWLDGDFGLDTAYPNKKFDPTAGTPWAAVFILPNQPEVATLGGRGEDIHDGVFQISLFYPPDEGDADIMAKADAIAAHYKAGHRYTYDGQGVLIRSCGRSQGRLDDGWYRIDLTVNWQSHVSRAPAPSEPCKTLESPGIFSAAGAGAMDINDLTATNTDGSSQGAHVESTVPMPSTDDRILFEVHYDPADWAGATGSNFVAIGDVTQGDDLRVNLEDTDGQNNSALAFAAINSGGTGFVVYNSSGNPLNTVSSSLSEIYAQVVSEHAGGSVTFVTDKANFIVPVPENTNGTDYDWCGNTL